MFLFRSACVIWSDVALFYCSLNVQLFVCVILMLISGELMASVSFFGYKTDWDYSVSHMQPNGLADFKHVNKRNKDIWSRSRNITHTHTWTFERRKATANKLISHAFINNERENYKWSKEKAQQSRNVIAIFTFKTPFVCLPSIRVQCTHMLPVNVS